MDTQAATVVGRPGERFRKIGRWIAALKLGSITMIAVVIGIFASALPDLPLLSNYVSKFATVIVFIGGFFVVTHSHHRRCLFSLFGILIAAYITYWMPTVDIYAVSILFDLAIVGMVFYLIYTTIIEESENEKAEAIKKICATPKEET